MSKTKCTIRDGVHVEPCDTLREMTEGQCPPGKARGIYVWPFINLNTREATRTIFGAKSSSHPRGLIFNFCPWCGVDHTEATKEQP